MTRIKFITYYSSRHGRFFAGEEHDVTDEQLKLINPKVYEIVERPKTKSKDFGKSPKNKAIRTRKHGKTK